MEEGGILPAVASVAILLTFAFLFFITPGTTVTVNFNYVPAE